MRETRPWGIILLAVGILAGVDAASATAVRPSVRPAPPTLPATPGIGVARLGSSYAQRHNYNRYGYVIVGLGDARAAGRLRAKSLVYMSGTSITRRIFTGVTLEQARGQNWLLKDAAGNYLENDDYEALIADVGNPAYQKRWVDNVARFLSTHRNDGVFIDDVVADLGELTDHAYPPNYPTPEAWEAAMRSFVDYAGRALKAKGFYVLVSANGRIDGDQRSDNAELTTLFWKRIASSVSGLFSEYWLQLPPDPATLRAEGSADWRLWWSRWQGLMTVAQTAGADFFAEMYGTGATTNIMRYGRASFLLDWNGKGGAFMYTPDGESDPWNPEWTMNIGTPAGRKRQVGVGWRRDYTGGVALINPSPSTAQTFAFARTYYTADGTAVTSVTLEPTSAIILQRKRASSGA